MPDFSTRAAVERLLRAERGGYRKPFGSAHSLGLVYPNTYHVGMSNLGFQIVHRLVNELHDWLCERFFIDFDPPIALESLQPPASFDILAFSVSFELDYFYVLDFLVRSGIPPRAADRGPEWPVIVCGGVCVDVNPHPVCEFVDLVVNAEAEVVLPDLLSLYREHRGDRRAFLNAASQLPGTFVTPAAANRYDVPGPQVEAGRIPVPDRVIASQLGEIPRCTHIVTPNTEFSDMVLVELARGCPYRCTFCFVGHNLNPYRTVPLEILKEWIAVRRTQTERFGFVASAVASHPQIDQLCAYCDELNVRVSYSSLRAEDVTLPMLRTLARSGARSLTVAPEAGSFRLRRLLGKARLSDERLFWVIENALRLGMPNLKLYFMVGIPTETEDDVLAIPELLRRLQREFVAGSRPWGRIGSLSLNLSIFVPIPSTPLAKFEPLPVATVRNHLAILERQLRKVQNVRFQMPSLPLAQAQRILVQGDLRSAEFLKLAHAHEGNWRAALRDWDELAARAVMA